MTDPGQIMKLSLKLNAAVSSEIDKLVAQGWDDHGLFKNDPDALKLFDIEQDRDRNLTGSE